MTIQYSNFVSKVRVFFSLIFMLTISQSSFAKIINISVTGSTFEPLNVSVEIGDVVRWSLVGEGSQSITCDGIYPGTYLPGGASSLDQLLNSEVPVFEYVISSAGSYHYVSKFHSPRTVGTIIAEDALPVELTDFVATTIKNEVILDWYTGGEMNNDRFEIQRIKLDGLEDQSLTELPFVTIGYLRGYGTINHSQSYRFRDKNLETGTYLYRLRQVDFNSNYIYYLLNEEINIGLPSVFSMSQNYPNPFNPVTRINFELPDQGLVKITLIDISGKEAGILINENMNGGYHSVEFNGSNHASGVYYYKIDYRDLNHQRSIVKKLILLK